MPFGGSGADCAMSPMEWHGAGAVFLEPGCVGTRSADLNGHWFRFQSRKIRLNKTRTSSPRVVPLHDTSLGTLSCTPQHVRSGTVPATATHASPTIWQDRPLRGGAFRCDVLRPRFAFLFAQQSGDLPAHQAILDRKTIAMEMRY
jgi:hypothetical protein